MIGSTNIKGGSGGLIVVSAAEQATATVSNAAGRVMTQQVDPNNPAIFRNLAEGQWTVSTDNGVGSPSIQTVEIVLTHNVVATFFSANINITYPVGSVCTATSGSYSYTAPDTFGAWNLAVPVPGTWTITCTDGTDTATSTVNITTAGQTESVSLVYTLILYSPGDEHSATTGGWKVYQNATISRQSTYMKITPTQRYEGNQAFVGCTNMIDLTKYATLYAEGLNNCAGDEYLGFSVYDASLTQKASAWWNPNERTTKSLNVSKLSGKYYVGFEVYWGDVYKGDGRIYNVWGVR